MGPPCPTTNKIRFWYIRYPGMANTPVIVEIMQNFMPLSGVEPGQEPVPAGAALPALFPADTGVFAVLDAGSAPLLVDRLKGSGLSYSPLYDGLAASRMEDVAPYLVELDGEDVGLTTDLFRRLPDGSDPSHLLDKGCALLLQSRKPIAELRDRLRRMSLLPDETGVRMFFRMTPPGVLAAACLVAPPEEVAWFMTLIDAVVWARPSLEEGIWQLIEARPSPSLADFEPRPLVLTPIVRRAMSLAVAEERARALARAHAKGLDERIARAASYTRMMAARYDNEGWLRTTHDLLFCLPEDEARTAAWETIDSGAHSLGQAHARVAAANGLEAILP